MKSILIFIAIIFAVPAASAAKIEMEGKAVLVTGASSGIGRRIAETLASQGVFVYAGARKLKDIEALSENKNMIGLRLDVTKPDEISAAVKFVEEQGRGLYGLVNNAGVFYPAPLIEVSEADMQFMMDVNVFGPYRLTKAFAPLLIEAQGRVSTISSIAAFSVGPMFGPYSMSKASMEAFSDALSGEMKKFNVQVSVVQPGNFQSDIMKNMEKRQAKANHGSSLYQAEYKALSSFTVADRSKHKDPLVVAKAVSHALFSDQPKKRYMVVPSQPEADMTIRALARRIAQLNQSHEFSVTQDTIITQLKAVSP